MGDDDVTLKYEYQRGGKWVLQKSAPMGRSVLGQESQAIVKSMTTNDQVFIGQYSMRPYLAAHKDLRICSLFPKLKEPVNAKQKKKLHA